MEHKHHHEITCENEKKTLIVIIFTVFTMIVEILFGYITNSMALLADGYHMGTHTLALSLTYIAYILIRKFNNSELFPNGTEKIGTLTAYTSSLFLGLTGILIIIESIERLINPLKIQFNEAIFVATIGLIVNSLCVIIMEYNKKTKEEKEDYNFKAAYYHILADALTSILAIIALVIGKHLNIVYLDSIIGVLGGILILKWAAGLVKHTIKILTDMR